MKTIALLIYLLIISIATAFSQTNQVGDVKYSILHPDIFEPMNPGWVAMHGQSVNPNWKILELVHFTNDKLPDARGLFIRVMNSAQDKNYGDPDGDRGVGQYQVDGIKRHTHKFSDAYFAEYGGGDSNIGSTSTDKDNPNRYEDPDVTDHGYSEDGKPLISETRPRNITLYIYIKLN